MYVLPQDEFSKCIFRLGPVFFRTSFHRTVGFKTKRKIVLDKPLLVRGNKGTREAGVCILCKDFPKKFGVRELKWKVVDL